ncbi:MAG TPA: PTS sugar transporter subunit IIB [Gemmatimonadaceae bacterium]|nr:PTS sugar transporter subunit IIB [Gemmatimonadaceae bacterium]
MAIDLYRIDDRLIHGQVVVGWGQPLNLGFIALVDDEVAGSEWEQELYRMGVPPEMDVYFATPEDACRQLEQWNEDQRPGILLTGDIDTMRRLIALCPSIKTVNLGGIHHRAGRTLKLRYVYLSPQEEEALRALERDGVAVTAQDVPSARAVPLDDVLRGEAER